MDNRVTLCSASEEFHWLMSRLFMGVKIWIDEGFDAVVSGTYKHVQFIIMLHYVR